MAVVIGKGAHVRISYMPMQTVYVVDHVLTEEQRFYAVSEDGRSGRWFDFDDAVPVAPRSS